MRHPIVDMTQHLCWTSSGVVWATWRISPVPYGRRPVKEKRDVKRLHRTLWRSLTGEALALGVSVATDPVAVVEAQIEGVDLDDCPDWALEAEANLDRLEGLPLGERVFYLSVPLANPGTKRWSASWDASMGRLRDGLQLPRTHRSAQEIRFRIEQARRLQAGIPSAFDPRRVTVAEQVWLAAHAQRRGMLDIAPPAVGDDVTAALLTPKSGVAIPEPILDEGAKSDTAPKARVNPVTSRVLKVLDPRAMDLGQPSSYQALLVMTDTPAGGMRFPGAEFLGHLDNWGVDVDWAVRLRLNAREKVQRANRKSVRELDDQRDQQDGQASTGQHELDTAGNLLTEYQQKMAEDRLEVEVEHTVILAVPGGDAAEAQDNANQLAKHMADDADLRVERPVGTQEELWWAMQIGTPSTRLIRSYAQFATSDGFAMAVPFTTTKLGGRRGHPLCLNISSARPGIVHLDPGGYPVIGKSGSVAWVGELGAGKSVGMKTLAAGMVDTSGQLLAIDRSAEGEWATFAATITDSVIVDIKEPKYSMDPLRVLDKDQGPVAAQSFLTQLLNTSPQEVRGITLGQVLTPQYLAQHDLMSMRQVMNHLAVDCALEQATELAQHMDNYARLTWGRLIFDETLPPVDPHSPAVVWRTYGMEQPSERDLSEQHLYRSLRPEKIFGRAYYHLMVSCARRWAFADRSQVCVFACDEAHDIFSNPENVDELVFFVREGRRAKALLLVGSHDPDRDFGSETGRSLIPTRFVMRQTDLRLAQTSVRFLGISEEDPEFDSMVEELMQDTSPADPDLGVPEHRRGEAFLRDAFGGVGKVKVLAPARPDRAAAVHSTPPKSHSKT